MQQEMIANINYVLALYDNEVTEELRNSEKQFLTSLEKCMSVLNDMMSVARTQLQDHKFTLEQVFNIIQTEYTELEIENFLSFDIIRNVVLFSLYTFYPIGYIEYDFYDLLYDIIDTADEQENKKLKTDLYCCVIKIMSRLDIILHDIEFTQKIMDYYNSLPEEEQKITILPDALTAF